MSSRVHRWASEASLVVLLSVVMVGFCHSPIRAEAAPGQDENEMSYDSLRLPGPGEKDPGDDPGDPIGPRQGADPNDFSVSSPRPPQAQVTEVPRFDLLQLLRTVLHFWLSRLVGPIHGA